jgi:Zn-finger nucleic acid-binding protein
MADSAHTLNCLMCGAPTRRDASNCEHCGARLATVACPSCFGMIFTGSRFCPLCGSRADREIGEATVFNCPRCKDNPVLTRINIGKVMLNECGTCEGIWADKFSFEQICTDREQQGAILGPAVRVPLPEPKREKIRYIRCPECNELMQRMNFAGASGVIIDMCPQHGSWFDNKELQQIIAFLRSGGMDRLRQKEIAELNEARRRVEAVRKDQAWNSGPNQRDHEFDLRDVVWAAGSLISHFFKKR